MDSDSQIDIRGRLRSHIARSLTIARLSAPDDWQDQLRYDLSMQRALPPGIWSRDSDVRLFLESFAIFFVAAMMFLI